MEYLLQDVQQGVAFAGIGATLVNLPHPARYALHKLVVAGERPVARIAKSNKDIRQAAALLSWLKENADRQVREAWHDIRARGPGWPHSQAPASRQCSVSARVLGRPSWASST